MVSVVLLVDRNDDTSISPLLILRYHSAFDLPPEMRAGHSARAVNMASLHRSIFNSGRSQSPYQNVRPGNSNDY